VYVGCLRSLEKIELDGSFTYTPSPGYVGPDSFSYTVSDGTDQATATVTIDVTADAGPSGPPAPGPGGAPYFSQNSYFFTVAEGTPSWTVIGQASAADPDGQMLSYNIVAGNDAGYFYVDYDGNVWVGYGGSYAYLVAGEVYTLTVEVSDPDGNTVSVQVTISVTDPLSPPL
jgi:hypothetical protein